MADTNSAYLLALTRRFAADGTAKRLRESARLSQHDVARSLGVHVSTVSRWESGECPPGGTVALSYGQLLAKLEALDKNDESPTGTAGLSSRSARTGRRDAIPA